MDSKVKITLVLEESSPKGTLLQYLKQEQLRIYQDASFEIEKREQPVTFDEIECLLTLPSSENNRLDGIWDNTKIVKEIQRNFIFFENISDDIRTAIHLPDRRGAQKFIYQGKVLEEIIKPPTVTLDTNVLMVLWKNRKKIEHVKKLLKLGENFQIDLAVTGRIRDDVPRKPLSNRVNELPSLNIHEIGSVIRLGHWQVGDVAGDDDFKEFFNSPVVIKKLKPMNKKKCPNWRDWDHLHTL